MSNNRVYCRNVKELYKILTYEIEKKLVEKIVDFRFDKYFDNSGKSLFYIRLYFKVMKKNLKRLKNYNLTINVNFFPEVKFSFDKTNRNESEYKYDKDKNQITYTIKNFMESESFEINLSIKLSSDIFKRSQSENSTERKILQSIFLKYLYEVINK